MGISKSLEKIWTASSGTRYKGRVRITKAGKKSVSHTKTFATRIDAEIWMKKAYRSAVLGGIDALTRFSIQSEPTVGDVLKCVLEKSPTSEKLGRSKKSALKMFLDLSIAKVPLSEIRANHMFMHCEERKSLNKNIKSQTLAHDFSYISTSLKDANSFYGYSIDCRFLSEARSSLQRHGIISRSNERSRRPTKIELDRIEKLLIYEHYNNKESLPMLDIFNLAKSNAFRRSEFTNLRWSNINWENKYILVKDRKNPDHRNRHTDRLYLSDSSFNTITKQPKSEDCDYIFPFRPDAISEKWRKVREKLKIEDLRFHDLRAESACRLFESGLSAVEVSKITGHRDINTLNNFYLRLEVRNHLS